MDGTWTRDKLDLAKPVLKINMSRLCTYPRIGSNLRVDCH